MTSAAKALPAVLERIDADLDKSLDRLFDLVRIPSISTDSAYKDSCRAAADHVAKDLESLGFETAVTTRKGVLFPDHGAHLTALPRISVNGEFQRLRYLEVLLSGAPSALMNRFRRVDAA